jgi:hypothetical protein
MRVLFIGEGSHDIGAPVFAPEARAASGVIPSLTRRTCPAIAEDSVALTWREIPILDRRKRGRGFAAKVKSAILLSAERFQLAGTVCVADQGRDGTRLPAMEEGRMCGLDLVRVPHVAACGVAVESIEAWTLGAPEAIARVLEMDPRDVQSHYRLRNVESFYEHSGKPELRPKEILRNICAEAHVQDSTELRTAIGECTDIEVLKRNCPLGFRPFAEKLEAAFGPR